MDMDPYEPKNDFSRAGAAVAAPIVLGIMCVALAAALAPAIVCSAFLDMPAEPIHRGAYFGGVKINEVERP